MGKDNELVSTGALIVPVIRSWAVCGNCPVAVMGMAISSVPPPVAPLLETDDQLPTNFKLFCAVFPVNTRRNALSHQY